MNPPLQSAPAPGTVHTLTPHDLAVSGGSIARLEGLAVFLDRGLPGETLRCRITEKKPRFLKAEVLETLSPSPDAVPSFCAFADRCGGCAWTTLAYPAELAWKERHVKEALRRIGKIDFDPPGGGGPEYLPITPSPRETRYRNKVEFAFGLEDGSPALGLRERNAHTVVSITDCALCALPAGSILARTRSWMRDHELRPFDRKAGYLRFLVVRCPDFTPDGTPRCLVECITAPGSPDQARRVKELGETLLAEGAATGFIHSVRTASANVAYGEKTVLSLGETTVAEQFGDVMLTSPAASFLQANTGAATLLYNQIRRYAGENRPSVIWDLYCGVGGIALSLAGDGVTVRGIESISEAVRFAKKNATGFPGDIAFIRGDAKTAATSLSPSPDLVVTDPPRAGMTRETTDTLLRLRPPRIVAVSCDAASLARDVAILGSAYALKSARAVDLFPHTPHVEIAALLELSTR